MHATYAQHAPAKKGYGGATRLVGRPCRLPLVSARQRAVPRPAAATQFRHRRGKGRPGRSARVPLHDPPYRPTVGT
jgi:hypothetical protein